MPSNFSFMGTLKEKIKVIKSRIGLKDTLIHDVEESGDGIIKVKTPRRGYNLEVGNITANEAIEKVREEYPTFTEFEYKTITYKKTGKEGEFIKRIDPPEKIEQRWQKKKNHIHELANNISRLRLNVSNDMKSDNERTALIATIVALLDRTGERIGNKYSVIEGKYGVTYFKKKHLKLTGTEINLNYIGKSGVPHNPIFKSEKIAAALKNAIKNSPSRYIFQTSDGLKISEDMVNEYLDEFDITAKVIRGYFLNHAVTTKLRSMAIPEKEKDRKKLFNTTVKQFAAQVGHGAGTCKKHYIVPELPEQYITHGKIIDLKSQRYYKSGGKIEESKEEIKELEKHGTESLWMADGKVPSFPSLKVNMDADVCIVGGGISGISCAYQLLRKGKSVVVLEKGEIGSGDTLRTTAHLVGSPDDSFSDLERLHGKETTLAAIDSHRQAIDEIERICIEENLDCGFERINGYIFSDEKKKLKDEYEIMMEAGLDHVVFSDTTPITSFDAGSSLVFPNQAKFNPRKYISGLSKVITKMGGRIFANSEVVKLEGGKKAYVKTKNHTVKCRSIIVATHSPVNNLVTLQLRQASYRSYVITAVLKEDVLEDALYWDTEDPYHYIRVDKNGEELLLTIGGEDHRVGHEKNEEKSFGELERWIRHRFPIGEIKYKWSGQIMEANDKIAFIGRNPDDYDNVFVVTGESGTGMTYGTMAGMLLSDLIVGNENPWEKIYDPNRTTLGSLGTALEEGWDTASPYLEWLTIDEKKSISPGEGTVINKGLSKIAVYKDENEKLHAVSAVCTHAGCIVDFNNAEKSWDCPCHGSRFNVNGEVLNGPAIAPLSHVDLGKDLKMEQGGMCCKYKPEQPIEFAKGGTIPQRYKDLGFSYVGQKKKSTRPEKKWMVLAKKGDKYRVVHGGQKGMEDFSQHKDKKRQRRFWDRMGGFDSEKTKDPFSPLYWHKRFGTWEDGGSIAEIWQETNESRILIHHNTDSASDEDARKTIDNYRTSLNVSGTNVFNHFIHELGQNPNKYDVIFYLSQKWQPVNSDAWRSVTIKYRKSIEEAYEDALWVGDQHSRFIRKWRDGDVVNYVVVTDFDIKNNTIEDLKKRLLINNNFSASSIQYARGGEITQSDSFKKWFGHSKVVDKEGNPLVVYHGTQNKFNVFDKSKLGTRTAFPTNTLGFFFSGSKRKAEGLYANYDKSYSNNVLLKCFLKIENPYITTSKEFYQNNTKEKVDVLRDKIKGHDGIIVLSKGWSGFSDEYVVFEPTQIKLADGNNTTFDSNNPDIRKDRGGLIPSEAQKQIDEYIREGTFISKEDKPVVGLLPISRFNGLNADIFPNQTYVYAKGIKNWKERIQAGERPYVLIGYSDWAGENRVKDAHHRLAAYHQLGFTEIPVIDVDGRILSEKKMENGGEIGSLKFQKLFDNLFLVTSSAQEDLAKLFIRPNSYLDSKKFKGKIFTLEQFKKQYIKDKGAFTYYSDYKGFNIPDSVVEVFLNGDFNPLSKREKWLMEKIKSNKPSGKYYVIGYVNVKGEESTRHHEFAHALYYLSPKYKAEVNAIIERFWKDISPESLNKVEGFLTELQYDKSIWNDETNAYLLGDVGNDIWSNGFENYRKELSNLFERHYLEFFGKDFENKLDKNKKAPDFSDALYPSQIEKSPSYKAVAETNGDISDSRTYGKYTHNIRIGINKIKEREAMAKNKIYSKGGDIGEYKSILEMPRDERIHFIERVIENDPFYTEKKGSYNIIAAKANEIVEKFFHIDKANPIYIKGDKVYFEPDYRMVIREGYLSAQAKYAAHFVTIKAGNERFYASHKVEAIRNITESLKNPMQRLLQDDRGKKSIVYVTEVATDNLCCMILEIKVDENGALSVVTTYPDKKMEYVEKKKASGVWTDAPFSNPTEQSPAGKIVSGSSGDTDVSRTQDKDNNNNDTDNKNFEMGGNVENLIKIVENKGKMQGMHEVEETAYKGSGNAIVYNYNNTTYEIVTWNSDATMHISGSKTIAIEDKNFNRPKNKIEAGVNIIKERERLYKSKMKSLGQFTAARIEDTDKKEVGGKIKEREAEYKAEQLLKKLSKEDMKAVKDAFDTVISETLVEHEKKLSLIEGRKAILQREIDALYEKERGMAFGDEKRELTDNRRDLNSKMSSLDLEARHEKNIVKAISNGGELVTFTDKKGTEHKEIPYFVRIKSDLISFDEDTILTDEAPPYIPFIDEKVFAGKGYIFDAIRIKPDQYILAANGYHERRGGDILDYGHRNPAATYHPSAQEQGYVIVSLDQLALINDYYFTKAKATERKKAEDSNLEQEKHYDKLPEATRTMYVNQRGFYHSLPASIKKKITQPEFEALSVPEKEKLYKPFGRASVKRLTSKLEEDQMWVSFHEMFERFVNPEALPFKKDKIDKTLMIPIQPGEDRRGMFGIFGNKEVFAYWYEFRDMMKWKIKDIQVQREVDSEVRKIALETSFGESNTNDALKEEFGILVKRQDGSKISPADINQIGEAWIKVQNTFGTLIYNAKKDNLKISHTGQKLVFASRAAGVFIPDMKTIAVSNKFGAEQFTQIMAHEVAHWIDYGIGHLKGKRYACDDFESTSGIIARTFRKSMNESSHSDYINSTKECFARAMEQHFAFESFGEDATLIQMVDKVEAVREYHSEKTYVSKYKFNELIKPLIKKFLQEQESFFKYSVEVESEGSMAAGGAVSVSSIHDAGSILQSPADFKERIEKETGLKVSVKKHPVGSSMRGYLTFTPRKVGDKYPDFDFDYGRSLQKEFPGTTARPNFFTIGQFSLFYGNDAYNFEEGGEINVFSASSRFRPSERIIFEKPIIGPSGAQLISYEWRWQPETYIDREGEDKVKRVSDWTAAESSADTGRDIVHQFSIKLPNGEVKTVSSESVLILLGYTERNQLKSFPSLVNAVKTLAKQKMKLAILEAQEKEYQNLRDKFIKAEKPAIEYLEPSIDNLHFAQRGWAQRDPDYLTRQSIFRMGDVTYRQDNPHTYNHELNKVVYQINNKPDINTIDNLTASWSSNRIEEAGGKFPNGLYELRNRIARQERKVNELTKPDVKEVGGRVNPIHQREIDYRKRVLSN